MEAPHLGQDFSFSNPADAFRSAMADNGIITNDPIVPDGALHRIHIEGHSIGSKNGAYVLHADSRVNGWFKDYKSSIESRWSPEGGRCRLTKMERQALQVENARRRAERDWEYEAAARSARNIYGRAVQARDHAYLQAKGIPACHGLRLTSMGDLLVPASDFEGRIWSVQRIFKSSDNGFIKLFLRGGKTAGMSFRIAGADTIGICEGIATGVSLRRETGHTVYVAFGANNLLPVARGLRQRHPTGRIIIYGDNDLRNEINTGLIKSREAAQAICGELSVPPINGDYNDYLDGGNGY